jgi:acetylornithine deacetylase/succinyl-diaminopimelate desuccinylase-like protein
MQRERLVRTATELIAASSPTGSAGEALDRAAAILSAEGFTVQREPAGHSAAAVICRLESGSPGRTLQFNGHLDTVHLPFAAPAVQGDLITGSGASDMKGGTAAAIEALRMLRDSGLLKQGSVLLTLHDLHEAPWGFGEQLNRLIELGIVGDAVLLPEPLCDRLPVIGRGAATWRTVLSRSGPPVHEVMRPKDEPSVIAAGAKLIGRLEDLERRIGQVRDPLGGPESVFIGQVHSGEIYNQYPSECMLEGTRRWLPTSDAAAVETELRGIIDEVAQAAGVRANTEFRVIRHAFKIESTDPLVRSFQRAHGELTGAELPVGPKPFVDDGNSFYGLAGIPAITHGPRAGGQHTVSEWVSIADMERVAVLYALTALDYCAG